MVLDQTRVRNREPGMRVVILLSSLVALGVSITLNSSGAFASGSKLKRAPRLPPLGTIVATVKIPGPYNLGDIAYGAGAVWVEDAVGGVVRIDPRTNAVTAHIATTPFDYGGIVVADGAVFVAHFYDDSVTRIDPASNSAVAKITLGHGAAPEGIATTRGSVWVATHHGNAVDRIDTATNHIIATIRTGQPAGSSGGPQSITAGAGSIWVGVPNLNAVLRLNPQTNTLTAKIKVGSGVCGDLAADDSAAWITNSGCGGNAETRIDPSTNTAVPSPRTASQMTGAVTVNGNVYLTVDTPRPGIVRIDEATNKVTGSLPLPGFPTTGDSGHTTIVYGDGSLWVRGYGKVVRIRPVTGR
jgi:YVTN family beta-propeller protein